MTGTIINGLPFAINDYKPGFIDSFEVPAKEEGEDFAIAYIKDTAYTLWANESTGNIKIPVSGHVVAVSICNDYADSLHGVGEGRRPLLFALEGKLSRKELRTHEFSHLAAQHINWLKHLVSLADDDWHKYHNNQMIL